jgi:hypothetical protein
MWRSKTALWDLLSPLCKPEDVKQLSYFKRVQKVYGYDVDSQFKVVHGAVDAVQAWGKAQKSRQAPLAIKYTPVESLCIAHLKSRFELGASFVATKALMDLVSDNVNIPSSLDLDGILDAMYRAPSRPCHLMANDIFFTIVDPYPERKKLHRDVHLSRESSVVVARLHGVRCIGSSFEVDPCGRLHHLNLRAWCSSTAMWRSISCGLLRCDRVTEHTTVVPAVLDSKPQLGHRLHEILAPSDLELAAHQDVGLPSVEALATVESIMHSSTILKQLLQSFESGGSLGALDIALFSDPTMEFLISRGVVAASADEFGEMRYSLVPERCCFLLGYSVDGAVLDVNFERPAQSAEKRNTAALSKIELLHELLDKYDFVPLALAGLGSIGGFRLPLFA